MIPSLPHCASNGVAALHLCWIVGFTTSVIYPFFTHARELIATSSYASAPIWRLLQPIYNFPRTAYWSPPLDRIFPCFYLMFSFHPRGLHKGARCRTIRYVQRDCSHWTSDVGVPSSYIFAFPMSTCKTRRSYTSFRKLCRLTVFMQEHLRHKSTIKTLWEVWAISQSRRWPKYGYTSFFPCLIIHYPSYFLGNLYRYTNFLHK